MTVTVITNMATTDYSSNLRKPMKKQQTEKVKLPTRVL